MPGSSWFDFISNTLSNLLGDILFALLAALGGIILVAFKSEKFRIWLKLIIGKLLKAGMWSLRQWRYILVAILLFGLEGALYKGSQNILLVAFSIGHLLLFLILFSILNFKGGAPHTTSSFDASVILDKWRTPGGWRPVRGAEWVELAPHENLRRVLICEDFSDFINGDITCEVKLTPDALFDLAFRGDVHGGPFYMARFDARPGCLDGILFSPGGPNWQPIQGRELPKHTSPDGQWLVMKIQIQGKSIRLFQNDQLVDQIASADIVPGRISMFAEVANVYVRRITVAQ